MGLIFLIAFIWAVKKGQLDDLETPAHRMLFDDKKYLNQKVLSTEEQQNE
jgi:cbb3-type cytochrome oxidase maturation protein